MRARDWPLVLFTLTGQAAAGLAFFLVLPAYTAGRGADPDLSAARLGAALAVLGLLAAAALISLFHLGRPGRAPRALANAGRSWLSREIAAEAAFGGLAAALAVVEAAGAAPAARAALAGLTAAAGAAFVLAMARLYALPAVPAWRSWRTTAAFFGTTILLGATTAALMARADPFSGWPRAGLERAAIPAVGLALLLAAFGTPGVGRHILRLPPPPYPAPRSRSFFFGLRLVLLGLASILWALASLSPASPAALYPAAWLAAISSEAIGRLVFYSLADGL